MPLEPTWFAATLLHASNLMIRYHHVYPIGLVSHTWSLGMEEQFYLLWPPLVLLAMRAGRRPVCRAAFEHAIEIDPESAPAYSRAGRLLAELRAGRDRTPAEPADAGTAE